MAGIRGPLAPDVLGYRFSTNGEPTFHASDSHDLLILCDTICRHASDDYEFPVFLLEAHNKRAQSLIDRFKRAISICEATSGWDPLGVKEVDPGTGESRSVALCQIKQENFSSQFCEELRDSLENGVVEVVRSGLVAEEEYQ
ncbi:hypothetical protein HYALB_00012006 [Hymenoscyphus albidus]|uniref:Uncharacterized protein n=1 Tax=Hymenoscyphus albidus TaxID=595503 RepID=A0A9N9LPU5_9HELO|nr:hypothetical protein HYALB_00012006 [Hymenoscyphus albidus]